MCLSLLHVERHGLVIADNDTKWIGPPSQEGRRVDRLFSPAPVGKVDRPPVLADLPFQELALQCPVLAEGEDLAGALDGECLDGPDLGHATQGCGRFIDDAHFRRRRGGAASDQRHRKGEQNTDRRRGSHLRLPLRRRTAGLGLRNPPLPSRRMRSRGIDRGDVFSSEPPGARGPGRA